LRYLLFLSQKKTIIDSLTKKKEAVIQVQIVGERFSSWNAGRKVFVNAVSFLQRGE